MSRAETNILSCRIRYLVFRIRKGWTGLERRHRRGPVALNWLGSWCSEGSPAAGDGRWARANCWRPSVARSSTQGRRSSMSASAVRRQRASIR